QYTPAKQAIASTIANTKRIRQPRAKQPRPFCLGGGASTQVFIRICPAMSDQRQVKPGGLLRVLNFKIADHGSRVTDHATPAPASPACPSICHITRPTHPRACACRRGSA